MSGSNDIYVLEKIGRLLSRLRNDAALELDGCWCDDGGKKPECEKCQAVRRLWQKISDVEDVVYEEIEERL